MNQEIDRYRIYFEASADPMLILDDGIFVDCNQSALDMLGFDTRKELFSTRPADLSPEFQPDGRNSFEKADELIKDTLNHGSSRFDWIHIRNNNEPFPVEVLLTAITFNDTTVLHVVWRDVSERLKLKNDLIKHRNHLKDKVAKRTQELKQALLEAQLLGEVVKQSGSSIIITNIDGNIEYVNPAFTEINGYLPEEIYGKPPSTISSELQPPEFYKKMWDTIQNGNVWTGTLRNMRKSGELYWARLKIAPVSNDDGIIHHYVGIETDISDFIESKEKAEEANRAKSDFLSSMSHELRTPLNAIIGFSQLLEVNKNNNLDENQRAHVSHIKNAGDHLLSLINEILDLAKVEAGKLSFNIKSVDMRTILDECLDFSSVTNNNLNVQVFDRTSKTLPAFKTDPLRIKQVLLNLLSNAKKYNVENGLVFVDSLVKDDGALRISVTDTGAGISTDKQSELFKPFSRLDADESNIEGTGIGLVITQKIIEAMGGSIGFESMPEQGSTFWVDFPTHTMEQNQHISKINPTDFSLSSYSGPRTLLYVEDNASNRELMKGLVGEISTLDLICVETAIEGIEIARTQQPNLILMDLNLPGMDGFDAFTHLSAMEETQKIPIIALSANAMPETKEKAMALGFTEYVTKPFNINDIVNLLNTFIEDPFKVSNLQ